MEKATIIGVDLAKNVFQVHGAAADGTVLFRKKLTRPQFHRFMAEQPACLVAMEACGGTHYWAREMRRLGHDVRLIAPRYVKPFIKRQKNDAATPRRSSRRRCCRPCASSSRTARNSRPGPSPSGTASSS